MLIRVSLAATFGMLVFSSTSATALTGLPPSLRAPSQLVPVQAQSRQADDEDKQNSRRDKNKAKAEPSDKGKPKPQQTREPSRRDRQQAEDGNQAKQAAPSVEEKARRDRQPPTQETKATDQPDRKAIPSRLGAGQEKAPRTQEWSKDSAPSRSMDEEQAKRREDARTKGIGLPGEPAKTETTIQVQPNAGEKAEQDAQRIERGERRVRRDDPRVQEQARQREQQKTSAQELAKTRVEPGRAVTIDGGARTLLREGDKVVIRSDDTRRLRAGRGGDQRIERLPSGETRTIIIRADGTQIITITNVRGEIVRRYRRDRSGREIVLIEDLRRPPLVQINLPPLRINIPRERYIVDARRASRRDLEMVLWAPPVEPIERAYSLYEIRHYDRIRDKMPRIDLLSITFDTDSALITPDQAGALEYIASIMLDMINRNPAEVFLVEGHTDGTGTRLHNLALSDRRAEAVAFALSEYFDVPPENLVTQGYGPDFPKIPTMAAERENRRVAIRRIGPLLAGR